MCLRSTLALPPGRMDGWMHAPVMPAVACACAVHIVLSGRSHILCAVGPFEGISQMYAYACACVLVRASVRRRLWWPAGATCPGPS